jgi:two-component system sensor histidine kinase and response regulator WspE
MGGETFNDAFMLEIFRSEVETHVESLTAGLLALERNPEDTSHIDEMMRGAHSIKGAARIVGIDPAVRIAHVIEDGFIAAQNGKLTLRPAHVDVLLRGVDMLSRIANASKDATIDWADFDSETRPLVAEITAVLAGAPLKSEQPTAAVVQPSGTASAEELVPKSVAAGQAGPSSAEITIPLPALLDAAAAETARRSLIAGLDSGATIIRFDLSLTRDLDAIGLALLAAVPVQVQGGRTMVELSGVAADLQRVLDATGVDRLYSAGAR